jgi:hypothetical protein
LKNPSLDLAFIKSYLVSVDLSEHNSDKTQALSFLAEDLVKALNAKQSSEDAGDLLGITKQVIGHVDSLLNRDVIFQDERMTKWKALLSAFVFEQTGKAQQATEK